MRYEIYPIPDNSQYKCVYWKTKLNKFMPGDPCIPLSSSSPTSVILTGKRQHTDFQENI